MTIKQYYIFYDIKIEDYNNNISQFKIIIKLVSILKYNIKLKDWNINCINAVENIYDKILKSINL